MRQCDRTPAVSNYQYTQQGLRKADNELRIDLLDGHLQLFDAIGKLGSKCFVDLPGPAVSANHIG